MAENDMSYDVLDVIADTVSDKIEELRQYPGNEYNFPGPVQAAEVFMNVVTGCTGIQYMLSERLADIAEGLAEEITGIQWAGIDWSWLIDGLKAWLIDRENTLKELDKPIQNRPAHLQGRRRR